MMLSAIFRKAALGLLLVAGTLGAAAQTDAKPVTFIPEAGVVISRPKTDATQGRAGFTVGCQMQWLWQKNSRGSGWLLVSGLSLTSKPFKHHSETASPGYLQLPVRIGGRCVFRNGWWADCTVGGYVAERLWGSLDNGWTGTPDGLKLRNFDAGVTCEIGIAYKRVRLAGYCERGFVSMALVQPTSYHNFGGGIKLGYCF